MFRNWYEVLGTQYSVLSTWYGVLLTRFGHHIDRGALLVRHETEDREDDEAGEETRTTVRACEHHRISACGAQQTTVTSQRHQYTRVV